jgi:drug/metabolite transporter (DMT)-like permease
MKSKKLLFLGIALLIVGIVFRKFTDLNGMGLLLILAGVACKTVYIIAKTKSGEYNPGRELVLLFLGLFLFLTGLILNANNPGLFSGLLIGVGLSLKVIFILIFIRKTRSNRGISL